MILGQESLHGFFKKVFIFIRVTVRPTGMQYGLCVFSSIQYTRNLFLRKIICSLRLCWNASIPFAYPSMSFQKDLNAKKNTHI